jgi:pyruvate/2-oxoglutarate dehydrogenase complex dihydrolipoamide acyltransferase (E2) component
MSARYTRCEETAQMPKVQMPQLGESVAEGTIGKWLKKPGDHVDKYEPIVEVITDKVNAEVPSPFEGTLTEILVQEGETVPNNTDIAVIEGAAADAAAAAAPATGRTAARHRREACDELRPIARAADCPACRGHTRRSSSRARRATAVAAPTKSGGNARARPPTAGSYAGPTTPAVAAWH